MYKIYRIGRKNNKLYIRNGKIKLQIVLEFNKQWTYKDGYDTWFFETADVFITDGKKKVLYWDAEDGDPNGMNFGCFHLEDMMYDERIRRVVNVFRGRNEYAK